MAQTLYWHDYETFGLNPARDRPAQFAGVRTDFELNQIGEPLVCYCKPADDYLPQPEACLVTGITPQLTLDKGVCEAEFISLIHQQIAQAETCTLGYNSIRFDDEVTRNLLYRNFFDPYAREWQNSNSRWDLIDLVRAARALRPEGINWPDYEDGSPCFRLERLTVANGLEHAAAHDALSDVYATIEFARLVKRAQPKLYQFAFAQRAKNKVLALLKLGSHTPLIHVSGMYPSAKGNMAVVLPLCKHPTNANGVLVYDLSIDPEPMLTLNAEQIYQRLFTASENLPEDMPRIPLKTIHINKCPIVAPMAVLRPQDADRLQINVDVCQKHLQKITSSIGLNKKLAEVLLMGSFAEQNDPDCMIYSGGFFNDKDKNLITKIRNTAVNKLAILNPDFTDSRLPEMLFRYRARNYKETLNKQEQQQWQAYCLSRLTDKNSIASITYDDYMATLSDLKESTTQSELLKHLEAYAQELITRLQKPQS